MDAMLWETIKILAAGVVGYTLSLVQSSRKRRRDAKDAFAVFISQKLSQLPNAGVLRFYQDGKPEIRDQVARVRPFLTKRCQAKLDRLWAEYDQIPESALSKAHEAPSVAVLATYFHAEFTSPYDYLVRYFERFCKLCA